MSMSVDEIQGLLESLSIGHGPADAYRGVW